MGLQEALVLEEVEAVGEGGGAGLGQLDAVGPTAPGADTLTAARGVSKALVICHD